MLTVYTGVLATTAGLVGANFQTMHVHEVDDDLLGGSGFSSTGVLVLLKHVQ
jgi:hypothetical protein